jgi:hypothetical protein
MKRRWIVLAVVGLGLLALWQLPAALRAIPSRYVAAYLPEPVQALAARPVAEFLPTVAPMPAARATPQRDAAGGEAPELAGPVQRTETAAETSPAASPTVTTAPLPSPTPTETRVPIPPTGRVAPFRHQFQTWNNCGPATLAMALTYFGLDQSQEQTAAVLKPNPEDRNVSPGELVNYVKLQEGLDAQFQTSGDLYTIRRLIAAGFPVIVELGLDPPGEYRWMGWYGHYLLVVAYDDDAGTVWVYDSWFGTSEVPGENADALGRQIAYPDLDNYWRQFNRNYIVLFEAGRRGEVEAIIGPEIDERVMWQNALARAESDVAAEPDNAFVWFNAGTVNTALGDYEAAAAAFDQARNLGLPFRMLYYQFGPYEAYYQVGRYQDVVELATLTLEDRPYFEESYYYRGLALEALGDEAAARADFERAARFNPNYEAAVRALARLDTTSG